jgi:hypothetical protein
LDLLKIECFLKIKMLSSPQGTNSIRENYLTVIASSLCSSMEISDITWVDYYRKSKEELRANSENYIDYFNDFTLFLI